jgi:hypothetical protein
MANNAATALSALAILAILITAETASAEDAEALAKESRNPIAAETASAKDAEALAKESQNPIADLITLPIEENFGFGGLDGRTQHVVNVAPVYPLKVHDRWLLINRAIIPALISLPSSVTGADDVIGLGDINFTPFLSPQGLSDKYSWGVGPTLTVPSATDEALGTGKWSLGPSFVFLMERGPWVTGFLIANSWSIGGKSSRPDVNAGVLQPWLYYNFSNGAYVFYEPVITVDWKAEPGEKWTVPVGIGVGKIFQIGSQFMNVQIAGFYNVERPRGSPEWTIRPQIQFLFPK